MEAMWNYLRDPKLVAQVQKFFSIETKEKSENGNYNINNKFWYYLFSILSELGDELFYATFIPFWFWNCDANVGRKMVLLWASVMYFGQGLKEFFCEPRPQQPAVQLQTKWALEYGLPSTHAMAAISIPSALIIYTMNTYNYSVFVGLLFAFTWAFSICLSRIYLGMHSVLDIVFGICFTFLLMVPFVPLINYLDPVLISHSLGPLYILGVPVIMIIYFPESNKWTPTKGDTTSILSVFCGAQLGAWVNYQSGFHQSSASLTPPFDVNWPSNENLGLIVMRTILGIGIVALSEFIVKFTSFAFACALFKKSKKEILESNDSLENKEKTIIELCCKFCTYGIIGFFTTFLVPLIFEYLSIQRSDYYAKIS